MDRGREGGASVRDTLWWYALDLVIEVIHNVHTTRKRAVAKVLKADRRRASRSGVLSGFSGFSGFVVRKYHVFARIGKFRLLRLAIVHVLMELRPQLTALNMYENPTDFTVNLCCLIRIPL